MGLLSNIFNSLFSQEEVKDKPPTEPAKVTHIRKAHIRKKRKKADNTKLTKRQLAHLIRVYEEKLHKVKTYRDLTNYANKKWGLDKTHLTYYKVLSEFKKTL